MISRKLIKKQPGRKWLTYFAGLGLLVGTLAVAGVALAVHDLVFQLDGDTSTARGTTPSAAQTKDWDSLFDANGTKIAAAFNETATSNAFTAGTFIRDFGVKVSATDKCNTSDTTSTTFCTADPTTFATGSKDTLDITPGWQCNKDNNVNSKIDIMNAYAAQYLDGSTPAHRIMYFGLDKNKDNGNNNVAFWFLRSGVSCVAPSGSVAFSGNHQNGDVLVVSAFTNGGGVSNITAYMWNNGCIDNPSPTTPTACDGIAIGNGGDCKTNSTGGDSICATTNSGPFVFNTNIHTNWLTSDATIGVGHTVVPPDFFEGGIDLTAVFGSVGATVPSCFSTFIADTRSSQSLTATLFDYAAGQLGQCTTTLTTQQNAGSTALSIGTGTVSSNTDTATLTVNGASTWAGSLKFYLCGPFTSSPSCDTHGVLITTTAVSSADASHVYTSGSATLTSAGTYCWHAKFTPDQPSSDGGVGPAEDNGTHECFTVNPVTPTLNTQASCGTSDPCVLGVDTISDTATLGGTASRPGTGGAGGDTGLYKSINSSAGAAADNSITWNLYGPGDCGGTALLTTSRTVTGDNTYPTASQTPVSYKPALSDGVGTYTWVASYPSDSVNTNAATTTGCSDTAEQVTLIGSASLSSAQDWLPNDTVTLTTSGGTLTGTLTVTLYKGTFTEDSTGCVADASATAVSGQSYTFNPAGDASGTEYSTSNSSFLVDASSDGDYFWLVSYSDDNLTSPASHCESTSINITD